MGLFLQWYQLLNWRRESGYIRVLVFNPNKVVTSKKTPRVLVFNKVVRSKKTPRVLVFSPNKKVSSKQTPRVLVCSHNKAVTSVKRINPSFSF